MPGPNLIALDIPDTKKAELVGYLITDWGFANTARINQVDSKYNRWMDNYSGKPLEAIRTTPFYRASNFVPQLIRMHTDILSARIYGLILGTRPSWRIISLFEPLKHETLENASEGLDFISKYQLRMPEVLDTSVFRAFKTGHVLLKGPWIDDRKFRITGMSANGKSPQSKEITKPYLDLRPIAFDDCWVNPINIQWLRDARSIYHRIRLAKSDIEWRKANNVWDPTACDKLATSPETSQGVARESQATEAGIALTPDVVRPYSAIEATFNYELEPGKTYELVVVFNPKVSGKDGYLRGYYNPYNRLPHCYAELKFMPREDFIYGYSVPEILEQSQEEQAQIHNSRRDADTIGNIPTFKKKRYADQPNPSSEWYPGKVFELEAMDDLDILTLGANYNSKIDEEKFLLYLAEQYSGVQAPMQGYGAGVLQGKRGIYNTGATLAMLAEGNKRLDIFLQRARYPFHDIGNLMFQSYKQFRSDGREYSAWGDKGAALQTLFKISEPDDYPGFFFNIAASDAGANREVDKTSLLLMANTMAAYYRQIVEAGATLAQLPKESPLVEIMLSVLDGAKDLASRLLFAFDMSDRKRLLPDVRSILGGSPQSGAEQAERRGMPGSDEPLSIDRLQELSSSLGSIPSAPGPGNGGGGRRA
jgi:hypothetical protein